MATKKILFEDFYKTTIIDTIPDSWDVDFEVASAPENKQWWIIVNSDSSSLRERMFYHNVVWNRIYVRWVNRHTPKEHLPWSVVQINDSALIFNFLSENVSTTFWVEKLGWLNVNIWWWPILLWTTMSEVSDTTLLLSNNVVNYIYFDLDSNTIKTTTSENTAISDNWIIQVEIITASWQISEINYRKYSIIKWTPWEPWVDWDDWKSAYEVAVDEWFIWTEQEWLDSLKWEKWETWDIWEPTETGQYIEDTIIVNTSTHTVTTNNSTFVKITENATWNYVWYNLTGRVWANSANEVSNYEVVTWTWWNIWLLQWITYTDWLTIDTDWTIRYTGQPAYRDRNNTFKKTNIFEWQTIFQWNVAFPYYRIDMTWKTDILFDASKWTKQKTINLTTTWSKTLSFSNLVSWANYELAIVNNSWWNITIWKWTISNPETDITKFYSIWWTTYPLTLSQWVHIFVMDTFDTAIHISYVWQSVEF